MKHRLSPIAGLLIVTIAVLASPASPQDRRLRGAAPRAGVAADPDVPPAPARLDAAEKRRLLESVSTRSGASRVRPDVRLQRPDLTITPRTPFSAGPTKAALTLGGANLFVAQDSSHSDGYAEFAGYPDDLRISIAPTAPQPGLYLVDYAVRLVHPGRLALHSNHPFWPACAINFQTGDLETFQLGAGPQHVLAVVELPASPKACRLTLQSPDNDVHWYFYSWEATRLD